MKIKIVGKPKESPPEKKSPFSKGYSELRNRMNKRSKYTMSCYNCQFYYQGDGDKEEVCQNPEVLKYDMVITESSIFCNRWQLVHRQETAQSIFKKGINDG